MFDPMPPPLLQGRCILVVEDDYLLAEDIRGELEHQGAGVLGPAPRVAAALALLSTGPKPDHAILDINLAGELVYPVADVLLRRGVPFVFLTGYDRSVLPTDYSHIVCCEKPFNPRTLLQSLAG